MAVAASKKCFISTCVTWHTNKVCSECDVIGMPQSYCNDHMNHFMNPAALHHCAGFSASMTVAELLKINRILYKQLKIGLGSNLQFDRKQFVIDICMRHRWLSGDLLGGGCTAVNRRQRITREMVLTEKTMEHDYNG